MIGIGTLVNTLAIITGGVLGLFLKNGIPDRIKNSILKIMGLSVLLMGLIGFLENIFFIDNSIIKSKSTMVITIALVLGVIVGEVIDIEKYFEKFGFYLKSKVSSKGDNNFVEGFVTTSLIFCIGAMGILGSIADGINHDPSILYNKAMLDGITSMIFASMLGFGVIFSALAVFCYQGTITLLSFFIADYFTQDIMVGISTLGSIMIFCLGSNMLFKTNVKVGNMLPALLVAILFKIFHLF
ncbi:MULTISPECIES: DUF554 domain-containing protein [unclassified Gemella]|uniref:DUF554 domain-containing protein n=1 Tax=unclassified Gemella TaxID=2624949 RepID=UPI001C04AB5F|nr:MULTISPECIES: DUF554 domain-containing protein [unclassified Gemella]MBU0278673.1 DUF554 domain-containing protein [Gemella sp. zg-1178]QWQ39228.1 DUF554 domain-containing protein [Gemella sp. zg-570]